MAEYIDKQVAIEQIKAEWAKLPLSETTGFGILMRVLTSIPAADARPVAELVQMIEEAIDATNMNDAYSIGLKNGLRCAKAFIDGKEPEYEHVRPLILCRDCEYYFKDEDGYAMCENSEGYDHVTADGFCAWGEKREES